MNITDFINITFREKSLTLEEKIEIIKNNTPITDSNQNSNIIYRAEALFEYGWSDVFEYYSNLIYNDSCNKQVQKEIKDHNFLVNLTHDY